MLSKKSITIIELLIGILMLFIISCQKKADIEKEEVVFSGANYVKVIEAINEDIMNYLEYSGILKAEKSAYIAPDLSLKIDNIVVREGEKVKKGDLLAVMDSTQLRQAKAQFENAKKNYNRMKELKAVGSIDDQTFDQIESAYKSAKAAYEFMLANTQIRAPFDGIISLKMKSAGESFSQMSPGPTGVPALLRLVNLDKIKAKIQVSDKDINKIKLRQKAIINVDSEPEKDFVGKITFISPEADMMSGTFTCEVSIDNRNHILKPGQFARVKIVLEEQKNALVVPQQAIVDTNYIYVVKQGKAIKKRVQLGIQNEHKAEVISGIENGDLVVVSGNVGLIDNAKVMIK